MFSGPTQTTTVKSADDTAFVKEFLSVSVCQHMAEGDYKQVSCKSTINRMCRLDVTSWYATVLFIQKSGT